MALTIAGTLFLVVGGIVTSALSTGTAPPSPDPGVWLDWIGIPFLVVGLAFLGIGIWWALR